MSMSDASRPLPPKKEVALALLEGPSMFVHLDPRRQGVVVPKGFAGRAELVLQLGLNMAIPIPDLKIDDTGVTCTLSFGGKPFWCALPWSSVYALVGEDGKGMVWPGDVPPEVAAQMQRATSPAPRQTKRPRPKLAAAEASSETNSGLVSEMDGEDLLDGDGTRERRRAPEPAAIRAEDGVPAGSAKRPKRELPPYLRVIK